MHRIFICIKFSLLQPISTVNIYFICIVVLLLQPISTSAISFLASYLYRPCRCTYLNLHYYMCVDHLAFFVRIASTRIYPRSTGYLYFILDTDNLSHPLSRIRFITLVSLSSGTNVTPIQNIGYNLWYLVAVFLFALVALSYLH